MADNKFKLNFSQSLGLIYKDILQEDSSNYTPEFKLKVIEALIKIREAL